MEKPPFVTEPERKAFWHSTSHVLADAVKRLWPDVKLGFGPAIDEGFYYDFDKKIPFTTDDLTKIESMMKKITKEDKFFKEVFMQRKEAEKFLANEPYKLELLKEIPGEKISFHQHGTFTDLCNNPVIKSAGQIKAFKLLNTASAYWRGDNKRPVLQRIYGVSFPEKEMLDDFLAKRAEAEKRDHRKLGPQLGIFFLSEHAPAFPFFLPKGTIIFNELANLRRQIDKKYGFREIRAPNIASTQLYKTSGHLQHYKENMFTFKAGSEELAIRAMGCPSAIVTYQFGSHSYRELPLRLAEYDTLVRNEESGAWHGLLRVRQMTQDDAHIFCSEDQILDEISAVIKSVDEIYKIFGLKYEAVLSTRPEKFMGHKEVWDKAEKDLAEAMRKNGLKVQINQGDGAFYGPKIDFRVEDSLGRKWQCATIQLDFQQPLNFNLEYTGSNNAKHRPVVIHRVILGSLERFIGILIEHYAGAFPLWLAPVQVKLLTFTDRNQKYAEKAEKELLEVGLRVERDYENNTVEYKVRAAELEKCPYIIVIGDKEEQNKTLAVRKRGEGKVKYGIKTAEFIKQIKEEIEKKV